MTHFHPQKRFLIALPLGLVAGIVCVWLASGTNPDIWWTPLMWAIITNRLVIGLAIGLAGAYTHHPVFGFAMPWYIRGLAMGLLVSLSLAFGSLVGTQDISVYGISLLDGGIAPDTRVFWYTLAAGGVYGMVIDYCATKWGGEGKNIAG